MSDPMIADDGCRIAWRRDGSADKPALVLSNSLGTDMNLWAPQMNALAPHFDIIRYDTRGHGSSGAPAGGYSLDRLGRDVIELLDHLAVAKARFAGVSLGGMTGQWLGYRAPERFDRIVLANTSAYMGPPSGWAERIRAVLENGMEPMVEPVLERWFTADFLAQGGPALESVRKQLLATKAVGYAGCSAAIRDMDLRPTAALIEAETLVIGGTGDPATPPEHSKWLAAHIPHAQLEFLDAAHLSNVEQAKGFTAALTKFLQGDL